MRQYDRTRAINRRPGQGEVVVTYLPLYPEEIFFRTFSLSGIRRRRNVVLELFAHRRGGYVRPDVGLPAFRVAHIPVIRESIVRADAEIRTPQDLRGKRIGLPNIRSSAVVWMRGLMHTNTGVSAERDSAGAAGARRAGTR